jgi:uncharacterized protein
MARLEMFSTDTGASACPTDALLALGLMYCNGRGVERDYVAAHKWFNLAASKGNSEARNYRAEIAVEMSPGEIAEAQRLARQWLSLN